MCSYRVIESNLDCTICTPVYSRDELAQYVHRPQFKRVTYLADNAHSTNLAVVEYVVSKLDIKEDPYVRSLHRDLQKIAHGSPRWKQLDQKLSKVMQKQDSFTQRGLRDFVRSAHDIRQELGGWCADWYVHEVVRKATEAATSKHIMPGWKGREKAYLLNVLGRMHVLPVAYQADEILEDMSDKTRSLVQCILKEKAETELENEPYSCLVFVTRRDVVLALAELLRNHPDTKDTFSIGTLLGTSDTSRRHSFLDITTRFKKDAQDSTLREFKLGKKNLIISTSVAEEGIDVQACGSVIRWDLPPNVVSWAQSRGRARRQKSSFILMLEANSTALMRDVEKWEQAENEMIERIKLQSIPLHDEDTEQNHVEVADHDDLQFRIDATGSVIVVSLNIINIALR